MLSHTEMMLRMGTAAALGAVIGIERDRHGRPIGLRTHLIVALAAATFMVLSSQFAYFQGFLKDQQIIEVDASRIAASVVSAVGFLAAGSIIRNGDHVQGLTTAAGLWLVTAIGMCAGAGMFIEAGFATLLGVLTLTVLRRFERKDDLVVHRRISFRLSAGARVSDLVAALSTRRMAVSDVEYEVAPGDDAQPSVTFKVRHAERLSFGTLVASLESLPGAEHIHVRQREG
jgi:putative Mg2+ transporter-C (MgtC) family protein